MGTRIRPRFATVDGLSIRCAEGGSGPDALLLAPWPESVFAFEQVWGRLCEHARPVAVDLPGFGTSAALFAAAAQPDRFRSLVVGAGGSAVPIQLGGALKDRVETADLEPYRRTDGAEIVERASSPAPTATPSRPPTARS